MVRSNGPFTSFSSWYSEKSAYLGGAAGVMPCGSPMLAGYSGTKAHMAALSKSIHYEVTGAGICCQVNTLQTGHTSGCLNCSFHRHNSNDCLACFHELNLICAPGACTILRGVQDEQNPQSKCHLHSSQAVMSNISGFL